MKKEDLIKEINDQLKGLEIIADSANRVSVDQAVMLYDLQFRLKCKLYELEKEG